MSAFEEVVLADKHFFVSPAETGVGVFRLLLRAPYLTTMLTRAVAKCTTCLCNAASLLVCVCGCMHVGCLQHSRTHCLIILIRRSDFCLSYWFGG